MAQTLEMKRIHPEAKLPRRGTPASVGLDIYALLVSETGRFNTALIPPRTTRIIRTGLCVKPPEGYAVFVCSRSGLSANDSVFVTNAPGVVDPDYRGELMVLLYNGGHESYYVKHEDRIGQIILLPCEPIDVRWVENLDMNTPRGTAGLGSTGR